MASCKYAEFKLAANRLCGHQLYRGVKRNNAHDLSNKFLDRTIRKYWCSLRLHANRQVDIHLGYQRPGWFVGIYRPEPAQRLPRSSEYKAEESTCKVVAILPGTSLLRCTTR